MKTEPDQARVAGSEPPWTKEVAAHKRAMPMQRLLGNGMDYADAVELYRLADEGVPWPEAASSLGDHDARRAHEALARGHRNTARSWFLFASACYRFGQVPLPDSDPRKRSMYDRLIECFSRAGQLSDPPVEHVEIAWRGSVLCGWLLRPAGVERPPIVIQMGGFDGWREEYHSNATYLLDRGIACLLIDGPGQGETRLYHRLYMSGDVERAFAAMVTHLLDDDRLGDRVGIWGNSMGGTLAALAAAHDQRIYACCINGGSIRPAEILDRYPRFVAKIEGLFGLDDSATASAAMERINLDGRLENIGCPLHVVHGTPDQVFLIENARAIYEGADSEDKTFTEFPDGDHCIYNHSHEKNCLIADWFVERLDRAV